MSGAVVGLVLAAGLGACGGSDDDGSDVHTGDAEPGEAGAMGDIAMPFGLDEIEGAEPIGRPAVFDHVAVLDQEEPIMARSVKAAYRVTDDDPPAVVRTLLDQLDGLALDEASMFGSAGTATDPWIEASARQTTGTGEGYGDLVSMELWATDEAPILLVEVTRQTDDAAPPRTPTVEDDSTDAPPDPATGVESTARTTGEVLFTEQGTDIHLPEGTRALMPSLPIFCGTGGSSSVLAAEDGEAAVRALLDEASASSEHGETDGPATTTTDGVEVTQADFVIPAGGWGFDAVAVHGPDDPYATLYVTSCAD
jgi:hypothetical protein